jgi:hypothetical protein
MTCIDETSRECEIKEQVAQTSLVDIHRQVLSRLLRQQAVPLPSASVPLSQEQSIEALQRRLKNLKRKRLHLVSELERNKMSLTTLSEELGDESQSRSRYVRSEYKDNIESTMTSIDFAQRMHELRNKRRIASSHRIAGISVISCPDSLGIRMDICVHGVYVNRHYLFFQLMNRNKILRLVQHTVPQGCISEDRAIPFDDSLTTLRQFIGEVYDKCYFNAIRKDASDYLNSNESVTDLVCSNSLDSIAFILKGMHVQLEFSNLSALPTRVKVSMPKPNPPMSGQDIVSEEEEDDDDLLNTIRNAFCNNGVREAIIKVIEELDFK